MSKSRPKPVVMTMMLSLVITNHVCGLVSAKAAATTSPAASDSTVMNEFLTVPASEFVGAARAAVEAMRKAGEALSKFQTKIGDFRTSNAVLDCLDLLDFACDDLSWTIDASNYPNGKDNGTGDIIKDLRIWISAAFSDVDTCLEGFEGTNGIIKNLITGGLNRIGPIVRNLLTMVHDKPKTGSGHGGFGKFPSWVKPDDRKLLQSEDIPAADSVVAADGTGDFTTIMEAVMAAPDKSENRYVIYVKKGIYSENVEINKKKWNIMMIGDGIDSTVITGDRNFIDGWTTFRSATFAVSGRGFIARDITFENTAGPEKHQAVALRSDSDLSVFFRCAMRGYQDTLYAHTMRQFFRECIITGTVDFIFGDATSVFQTCQIKARQGLANQKNIVTAQGRKDPDQPTGFSVQFCNITADTDLVPNVNKTVTYLGRPWKLYSRTVFLQNYISEAVRPEGWLEWDGDFALDTLFYAEYMNHGPGARLDKRVKWPGYRVLNSSAEAEDFTVGSFIEGNLWLPATGVRFTAGLSS
ncbi:PREDICTED: probable pectinesterase/pectinesterase inhibitor 32 [Tarenaya hassleriana]|uniref:probable pectinesterase/pectinesterase inhibitor 32 n=1 Tax=Tarenaya hassleriana TaxID=28532 RepID=UPI00053C0BB0|nr:PREDICTED: probable pectinesterase/pectinesterase inhibitor 32 [Tarenaya hassleriana]